MIDITKTVRIPDSLSDHPPHFPGLALLQSYTMNLRFNPLPIAVGMYLPIIPPGVMVSVLWRFFTAEYVRDGGGSSLINTTSVSLCCEESIIARIATHVRTNTSCNKNEIPYELYNYETLFSTIRHYILVYSVNITYVILFETRISIGQDLYVLCRSLMT